MLRLADGAEVERYMGPYAARIDTPAAEDQLALSALPLRAADEEGRLAPVDLGLEFTASGRVPANPLVDARLPQRLEDGISVGSEGVRVSPGSGGGIAREELAAGKVFYPEVGRDTDWAVGAVPTGAEVLLQLRSAEAPESHVLDIDRPDGANLRASADGASRFVGARMCSLGCCRRRQRMRWVGRYRCPTRWVAAR